MEYTLIGAVFAGMAILLYTILKWKWPAFLALLLAAILTGLLAGMDPLALMESVKTGMGSTLGFVATLVGLGTIFGGILQHTGAASLVAVRLLDVLGEKRAPLALMLTGFLVSIPIFFDVGIVILFPVIAALQQKTGKNIVYYALPLLAGLAASHAFIPPTPGPLAVSEMLGIPLGWMAGVGIVAGLPAAYLAGILYAKFLAPRLLPVHTLSFTREVNQTTSPPSTYSVFTILLLPIMLIIGSSIFQYEGSGAQTPAWQKFLAMLCHPFAALILANVLAWYILGRKAGLSSTQLSDISARSLQPAGVIILVTGAGGVFKQILIDTGAGTMLAAGMKESGMSLIVFAFLAAAAIRILQGSATVAMISAAGLVAPMLPGFSLSNGQLGALGISIASGATVLSHLNDSGFWLVKEYFGLTEKEAIRMWTVASSILGLTGALIAAGLFTLL